MLTDSHIHFINNAILGIASRIAYSVADDAPGTEQDLFASQSLIIWSGASDKTVYQDCKVNWAFRAWHDRTHLDNGLGFSTAAEIEIGRIQASQCNSELLAELIYCEVTGQVTYYAQTGKFVEDQQAFTNKYMADFLTRFR